MISPLQLAGQPVEMRKLIEMFHLAVESTGIGLWEYEPGSGRIIWDARSRTIFDVAPETPDRYDALLEAIHPDDRRRFDEAIQQSLGADAEGVRVECRLIPRAAGERWLMAHARRVAHPAEPNRVVGTVLDVTDRKRREDELRANEEQFRRLTTALEEANRTKDQFLMTLSHELRTPLTAIGGWVRLLQSAKLSPEQTARALIVISRNIKTQTRIVDDLLDVSQIGSGELRVHPVWCDAAAVLSAGIDAVRAAADEKDIRIGMSVAPDAGMIFADPQRVQQVLWHALNNAVKFTGRCGQITVSCSRAGADVEIAVRDNGEGIAAQFIPFVFDCFSQADATPRREHGGQGLGLAIVRHLVGLHGGSARVSSDGKGLGTTLTVRLPFPSAADITAEAVMRQPA